MDKEELTKRLKTLGLIAKEFKAAADLTMEKYHEMNTAFEQVFDGIAKFHDADFERMKNQILAFEVLAAYSEEAFGKEDIVELGWDMEEGGKESERQKQFRKDMRKANREIEFYWGRFHYRGWATRVNDLNDLQEVIRDTNVLLQWDQLGKIGHVVYPLN